MFGRSETKSPGTRRACSYKAWKLSDEIVEIVPVSRENRYDAHDSRATTQQRGQSQLYHRSHIQTPLFISAMRATHVRAVLFLRKACFISQHGETTRRARGKSSSLRARHLRDSSIEPKIVIYFAREAPHRLSLPHCAEALSYFYKSDYHFTCTRQ
jgi:hypothetical protein